MCVRETATRSLRALALFGTILLTLAITVPTSTAGDSWPGWLGPERNGWVADFEAPETWPEELEVVWRTEVGTGYGSPLVSGNRVFVHSRLDENEAVACFDLKTGELIWRQTYPAPFKMGGGGEWHGKGPKSCPLIADGRIFVMSISGSLSAWDAESGKPLWRSDYGSKFPSSHPYWGATASPIVDGDRVIIHFGTDDAGALVALETSSGKKLWSIEGEGASYSSPLIANFHGIRQIVQWNHESLVGVDGATGQKLWSYPYPHIETNQNMPTPTIYKDRILVGGENRGVIGLKITLTDGQWSVEKLWHQKDVALDMSTAVMNNDHFYGMSHYGKGRVFCLDAASGDVLWQGPGRNGDNITFLSVPDHVVALTDKGRLQFIKASPKTYDKVADYRVSEKPTWAPPVLLPDGVLIKDDRSLIRWKLPTDNSE